MTPDAVVIGAGPNGLVAANLLADRGWSVVVLEASAHPGGAVRTEELIEPGFRNDVFSAFYPLAVASPVMRGLALERYGLRWRHAPLALAHPASDGTCPVLSRDLDETVASLDAACPGDGAAWARLFERWQALREPLLQALFTPFPPVRAAARLALDARGRGLARVARSMLLPVRRLGAEELSADPARRLLAGAALHADLSPEAVLSGFFGWLLCSLGQEVGFPVPEGGAGSLADALVTRLEERGGRVVCGAPVERVAVRSGRAVAVEVAGAGDLPARYAVVADVAAPTLYRELVGFEHLPPAFAEDVDRFVWDHATCKVDWTLDRPIPWAATAARRAGTVHVADSLDELTRSRAELACGAVPDAPFLVVGQQSPADATRQPAGRETAWAYTHVPRPRRAAMAGSPGPRTLVTERIADRMQERIEALAPGFVASIRGRHVMGPDEMEARDANLRGGAINAGTAELYQQLVFRPLPGLGRAETPVRALYLASASAHPGGGVHGGPGANAARAAVLHSVTRRLAARWAPSGSTTPPG